MHSPQEPLTAGKDRHPFKPMTANERVFNVTRRFSLKWKQAIKAIENCSCTWVEGKEGQEIRDLTFAEAAAMRKEQTKLAEPIAFAENPGLKVIWSTPAQQAIQRHSYQLIAQANKFCLEHA